MFGLLTCSPDNFTNPESSSKFVNSGFVNLSDELVIHLSTKHCWIYNIFYRFIQNLARKIWITILQCYGSDQKNMARKSVFPIELSLFAFLNCLNLWMNSTKVFEAICYSNRISDRNCFMKILEEFKIL